MDRTELLALQLAYQMEVHSQPFAMDLSEHLDDTSERHLRALVGGPSHEIDLASDLPSRKTERKAYATYMGSTCDHCDHQRDCLRWDRW